MFDFHLLLVVIVTLDFRGPLFHNCVAIKASLAIIPITRPLVSVSNAA
jgi:hypothetical protein